MYSNFSRLKYRILTNVLYYAQDKLNIKTAFHPNSARFFFIVGSGRNGSTLLARELNLSKDVFLPPEQFYLPYGIIRDEFNFLSKKQTSDHLSGFLENNQNWNREIVESKFDYLKGKDLKCFEVFDEILKKYARLADKSPLLIGDHSPILSHHIPTLRREYPVSKFIFLLRDPRDVVASYLKIKKHPASQNMQIAIWKWKDSLESYIKYSKRHSELFHLVKYEDLVSTNEEVMKSIYEFLEIEFSPSLSPEYAASFLGVDGEEHHKGISDTINSNSIGKWKSELDSETVRQIEGQLKPLMKAFGYS